MSGGPVGTVGVGLIPRVARVPALALLEFQPSAFALLRGPCWLGVVSLSSESDHTNPLKQLT